MINKIELLLSCKKFEKLLIKSLVGISEAAGAPDSTGEALSDLQKAVEALIWFRQPCGSSIYQKATALVETARVFLRDSLPKKIPPKISITLFVNVDGVKIPFDEWEC